MDSLMIKIVSGIDPKEGGHNPRIWSSHNNTEDFMSSGVLSPNAKSVTEDAEFYTIHFFGNYDVFSKHKIVRDKQGNDRMGVISFSLALLNSKHNVNILGTLESLQSNYENDKFEPKSNLDACQKTKKNKKREEPEKEFVYLYYEDEALLKAFFKQNPDYRKFKRIFFIDGEKYKDKDNNPLNSLQHCRKTDFEELEKPYTREEENKKTILVPIFKNRCVILLFGILFGAAGLWAYQNFIAEKVDNNLEINRLKTDIERHIADIDSLKTAILNLNDTINKMQFDKKDEGKSVKSDKKQEEKKQEKNKDKDQNTQDYAIETFLKKDCNDMNLNQIDGKLKQLNPNSQSSKLNSFGNFLEVLKKQTDLTEFETANKTYFNDEYEYVKLFKYLKENEISLRSINGINNMTLDKIKEEYSKQK
jgi:hypothetical protein